MSPLVVTLLVGTTLAAIGLLWTCLLYTSRQDWQSVGQGFDAVEASLKLAGWRQARRVVVLRRAVRDCLIDEGKAKNKRSPRQQGLHLSLIHI